MELQEIRSLIKEFEAHVYHMDDGTEFWRARELSKLLGYSDWRNFQHVIEKAQKSCEVAGRTPINHFVDVTGGAELGESGSIPVDDFMLSRYACYLTAQNGDPRKPEIAFAQTYFAVRTREAELIEQRLLEIERLEARHKLTATETELSKVIYENTGREEDLGVIRSKGDAALFQKTTREMKAYWKVPEGRPLADFAPTIILKAKDFATAITVFRTREGNLNTEQAISSEHIASHKAVRETLIGRGITPENLSPAEDAKKLERRITREDKTSLKEPDELTP